VEFQEKHHHEQEKTKSSIGNYCLERSTGIVHSSVTPAASPQTAKFQRLPKNRHFHRTEHRENAFLKKNNIAKIGRDPRTSQGL
jgi:hypothetical protein